MSRASAKGLMLSAALVFLCVVPVVASRSDQAGAGPDMAESLSRAVDTMDALCGKAAGSLEGLGREYAAALAATPQPTASQVESMRLGARRQGPVVGLQNFTGNAKSEPAYQAANVAIYSYAGPDVPQPAWRELAALTKVSGILANLHAELDLSWVYLTTTGDSFAIYPFLPLSDAVNNTPPTKQVFYTAAGFDTRSVGWTEPYLDLAGAGMMVTASLPVYDGDTLLGVASRDITLKQVVSGLDAAAGRNAIALVVDAKGLAVAASSKYAAEIETSAGDKGKAALHYRQPQALAQLFAGREAEAVPSCNGLLNAAGEAAVAAGAKLAPGETAVLELEHHQSKYRVSVRKTRTNGWLAVGIETA